jgi:hypothetical protein
MGMMACMLCQLPHMLSGTRERHSLVADLLPIKHVHVCDLGQLHAIIAQLEDVIAHAAVRIVPFHAAAEDTAWHPGHICIAHSDCVSQLPYVLWWFSG